MRRRTRQKTVSVPGGAQVARLSAGLTLALTLLLGSPATAWSDVPAAAAGSGPGSASAATPASAMISTIRPAIITPGIIALDPGSDFTSARFDDLAGADDGYVADALPHSLGKPLLVDAPAIDPFHVHSPTSGTGGFDWKALAKQDLGTPDRLALSIHQQFASSTSFATAINLRHTDGPLDVDVALTGAQSLAGPDRLVLAYDSDALVAMTPALRIGVTARGDLGALSAIAPAERQSAGPVMQLRLLGGRTTISSDAGYDFALNSDGALAPHRLHAKIDLRAKF